MACLGQVSGCGPINNEGMEQSHLGSTPCRAGVEQAVPSSLTPRLLPTFPSTELVTPGQRELLKGKSQYSVVHKNCLGLSAQSRILDF